MLMAAISCTKRMKTCSNMIVFNMSLAHFYVSSVVNTFTLMGMAFGDKFLNRLPGLCTSIGATWLLVGFVSFFNMILLAFER